MAALSAAALELAECVPVHCEFLHYAVLTWHSSLTVDSIPPKLRCANCNKLAVDAVKLPCCDSNICLPCVLQPFYILPSVTDILRLPRPLRGLPSLPACTRVRGRLQAEQELADHHQRLYQDRAEQAPESAARKGRQACCCNTSGRSSSSNNAHSCG